MTQVALFVGCPAEPFGHALPSVKLSASRTCSRRSPGRPSDPALAGEVQTRRYQPCRSFPFHRHDKAIGTARSLGELGQTKIMNDQTIGFQSFNHFTV